MPPRRVKKEPSTIIVDYPTPGESVRTAATVEPEVESIEIDLISDEGTPMRPRTSAPSSPQHLNFKSQSTEDEGYASRAANLESQTTNASQSQLQSQASQNQMAPVRLQGLEFVGSKVKLLVDGISELRKFGLQHIVGLPELVLVGDQSAGKSSLMSALTEVKLPRDQGICTKCPANIKTSPADKWSCKISLQQEYRYSPPSRPITEATVTKANPFPPWIVQDLEEKEFLTTENKEELEVGIKWAQLALLNHNTDYRDFIPGSGIRAHDFEREREVAEAKFSPNLIVVEISGPGLPALSFYDLPGVFRSSPDKRDQYLVKVIENLAIKYIKRPDALIIWTLAMKTDPSNSETGNIIGHCNASTRCIGVLTNPDHIAAKHTEYERVLNGVAHSVQYGFYVTKQPGENSTLEGANYHALAREEEELFFDTNTVWSGPWRRFRSRCGTTVLQKQLSQLLARQIEQSIPALQDQIGESKQIVEQKLRDCPALPDVDIRNIVLSIFADFSNDVKTLMSGDSIATSTFQNDWSGLTEQFRSLILHIKPSVTVAHASDKMEAPEVIELSDDESSPPPSRKRGAEVSQLSAPRKYARLQNSSPVPYPQYGDPNSFSSPRPVAMKRELDAFPPSTPHKDRSRRFGPPDNPFAGTPFSKFANLGKGFINLDEIRTCITSHACPGLPGIVDKNTYNELCLRAIEKWREPLTTFLGKLFSFVRSELQAILMKHLGKYESTQLYRTAKQVLEEYIDRHVLAQGLASNDFLDLELFKSFTINKSSMTENGEKEYETLKKARRGCRAKAFVTFQAMNDPKKRLSPDLTAEGRQREIAKRVAEVDVEKLGPDTFDLELRVASYVRAYYLTVSARFLDNTCLCIQSKLFKNIHGSIFRYLERELGIDNANGDEVCRTLMEEDPQTSRVRRGLQSELEKLNGFSQRLADLVAQINSPESEGDRDQEMRDVDNDDDATISGSPTKPPNSVRR